MGSKRSQFLGHVFEGAFKLGFLREKIEDYDEFRKKGVFDYIAQEYKDLEDLILVWKDLEKKFVSGLEDLKEMGLKYTEENLLYFLFLVGFYEGLFFGEGLKNLHLIKYIIGEDSNEAGRYQNADLMFISDKTLYVVDLKLGGAQHKAKYILDGAEKLTIPFKVPGVPVNLSLGEMSLEGFLNSLLKLEDELLNLQNVSPEIKGFLQTLSYAVDYLCEVESDERVSEVNISIFYPLAEPFSARFYWKGEKLHKHREHIRNMYEKLKSREWAYSVVENGTLIRNERLLQEIPKEIGEFKMKIRGIENDVFVIEANSIELAREDVKKRLDEFFRKEDSVKVLCLLHSAGSGKTTQTREAILNMEGNHIVLYTATRKVLLRREYEALSKRVAVVYEERKSKDSRLVENVGDVFLDLNPSPGILKRTVEEIKRLAGQERIIWALCTQQAITNTERDQSTSRHLSSLITPRIIDHYSFHIILDEFLGHSNGLFVIEEMFKFLKSVKERGGKANLYIFDANGYTSSMLKKLLEEYAEFRVMPDAIMICDYRESDKFEHNSIKVFVHAKHGYPSTQIILKKKFIQLTGQSMDRIMERIIDEITNYIKSTIQKSSTSFVYVQHKEMLSKLKRALECEGFSTVVATADSRKSQEMINKGNEDIILATSALSRGIDLSRPHKPVNQIYVVIHSWGIENNLVELIQTISRARGDKQTEEKPKEIHLIYSLFVFDRIIDDILEYIDEEVDKELIGLLVQRQVLEQMLELDHVVSQIVKQFVKSSEEGRIILVPLPKQYKTKYIPNQIADLEGLIGFIENIYGLTNHEKLVRLHHNLLKALDVSVVKINFKNPHSYYHPYILFERQEVRSFFDEALRGKTYALFREVKSVLMEHNEEKTKLLESFISKSLPSTSNEMPVLIPVYSYVLTKHFLKKGEKAKFYIGRNVGRGGADSMMGKVEPSTYCFNGENFEDEYACIPMGEEYPYKEVLSGRFAKFPIEFLRRLLDE